jgi:formylglycine-generating enzyme required for sulfatase activity
MRVFSIMLVVLLVGCGQPEQYASSVRLLLPDRDPPKDIGALVRIEGGTFTMGAPPDESIGPHIPDRIWLNWSRPQHVETVSDFEIGKYEVTAKEFCEFLNDMTEQGEPASAFILFDEASTIVEHEGKYVPRTDYELAPAQHVLYLGARRYTEWLSEKTGDRYRLPSEVEWEYVARGVEGRTYPWGDSSHVGKGYFARHYANRSGLTEPWVTNVGRFPEGATPEGVHDLIGNVGEWCGNCFEEYTEESITADPENFAEYVEPPLNCGGRPLDPAFMGIPHAATRGLQHVTRGYPSAGWTRTSRLISASDSYRMGGYGFRVLREIDD